MNNEFLKMQKLAGLITEGQYKSRLNEEEKLTYSKGDIIILLTKNGDKNGEVTVDSVYNNTITGYMKSRSATPIKVKITPSKDGEGYDVYDENDVMIRNNHKIAPQTGL
jgi:hypothetical protein